jgi:hypothetical protein
LGASETRTLHLGAYASQVERGWPDRSQRRTRLAGGVSGACYLLICQMCAWYEAENEVGRNTGGGSGGVITVGLWEIPLSLGQT